MDADEFERMMEEIDAELRRDGVRIDRRQIDGFGRACDRLDRSLNLVPLGEAAIPGKYEDDSLSAHILHWFERRYGDRLNMDFSVAHIVAEIRNDPWRLRIPRVFGTVEFICERRLAPYRAQPCLSVNGNTPVFNILNFIDDLPDGLAAALGRDELNALAFFFVTAYRAVVALEEVLHLPLVKEARDDLTSATEHMLSQPSPNCGFSKWSSLQFVEKLLKAFLKARSIPYRRNHILSELADLAEQLGLVVDRRALNAVQCPADVRYESHRVSMVEAIAAHHHSLVLCYEVTRAIRAQK